MKEVENFIEIPLFNSFDYFQAKMLYLNSHKLNLIKGDLVYKENDVLEGIFIVKSGTIRVIIILLLFC